MSAEERFLDGAVARVSRGTLVCALPAVIICWLAWQWPAAVGCAVGAALGYENFVALSRAVNALGARVVRMNPGEYESNEHGGRIVWRFLARYAAVGLAAYVIFMSSRAAFYGFGVGLLLPVAALLAEAGYEAYVALRRGT